MISSIGSLLAMKRLLSTILLGLCLLPVIGYSQPQPQKKRVTLGFIEGGAYPGHSAFRNAYTDELRMILPDEYELTLVPQGFKSAEWDRARCREMAVEIAGDTSVHIIVALGPWVVEDLLAAGCDKPIVAAYRFDPVIEGLVNDRSRPIADNLTVRIRIGKLESDLAVMTRLLDIKRLGFLHFPSGDEAQRVLAKVKKLGERLGFRVITAEGYDNAGTFAFFKAYKALPEKVDAVYLSPLWAFTTTKLNQFYTMTNRDRVPTVASDGSDHVERGALMTSNGESVRRNAYYHAWKTAQIIGGETPADLPVVFPERIEVIVNRATAQLLNFELPAEVRYHATMVGEKQAPDSLLIGLVQAVEQSLQQNPGYLAKYDAIDEAAFAAKQTRSRYLPQLGVSGSVAHYDDNSVHNKFGEISTESYRAGLRLNQTLLSLETLRSIKMSEGRTKLHEISLEDAALDLELAVTIAYLKSLQNEDVMRVRREYRSRINELAQVVDARHKFGGGNYADVFRWQDELSQATQALIIAEANLDVARVSLNVLLNQPGNMPVFLDRTIFAHEQMVREYVQLLPFVGTRSAQERSQDFLVMEALKTNPSLRKLGATLDIQQTSLSRNRARYYPRIGFQASLGFIDELAETTMFEEKHSQWSVGATFELPLFLGGDRSHERKRLKAGLSRVEYEKDEAALRVMRQVRSSLIEVAGVAALLPFVEESEKLTGSHRDLANDDYLAGRSSYVELLEAERNALESRLALLGTQYGYFGSVARLAREMGWSPHQSFQTAGVELFKRLAASGVGE